MNALIDAIGQRCTTLAAALRFDDPADEVVQTTLSIHSHALPLATTVEEKEEQAPYLVVRLTGFEDLAGTTVYSVRLIAELFTWGGVADGMEAIGALITALRPLCERGPGNIAGYKVIAPTTWQIGDKESGNQPHPFYECFCELRLAGAE